MPKQPSAFDREGTLIVNGDHVAIKHDVLPDLRAQRDVFGKVVQVSPSGTFIYIRLEEKLLPWSKEPEILVVHPGLVKKKNVRPASDRLPEEYVLATEVQLATLVELGMSKKTSQHAFYRQYKICQHMLDVCAANKGVIDWKRGRLVVGGVYDFVYVGLDFLTWVRKQAPHHAAKLAQRLEKELSHAQA